MSDFGKWHGDRAGIVRFEPLRLEVFACKIAGWAPSFEDFSGYSTVVKAQALFVLNRYLCGGVALRAGGDITWPQVLLAQHMGANEIPRASSLPVVPVAAIELLKQQRKFALALAQLQRRPLRLQALLAAQSCLCPEARDRGRLRRCDTWVQGTSVVDAKFVAVNSELLPVVMGHLVRDINELLSVVTSLPAKKVDVSSQAVESLRQAAASDTSRARADIAFAAHIALLSWHPFADGNGRVARALYQSLAGAAGADQDAALFSAAHLLVLRALQPNNWGQSLCCAQQGLVNSEAFVDDCRKTAETGVDLCRALLDGLSNAMPPEFGAKLDDWSRDCPLIRIGTHKTTAMTPGKFLPTMLSKGKQGTVSHATLEFLMAFELALRDCVEAPQEASK